MPETRPSYEGWSIVELMGHRKLAGFVSEQVIAGGAFLRLDVPSEPPATQFYSPAAVYCVTPTTEAIARAMAMHYRPEPVTQWELRQPDPPRQIETVSRVQAADPYDEFDPDGEGDEAEEDAEDDDDEVPVI